MTRYLNSSSSLNEVALARYPNAGVERPSDSLPITMGRVFYAVGECCTPALVVL
ncbi:MAG: hypothetical protein QXF17_00485 [Ignisphaera sp.]